MRHPKLIQSALSAAILLGAPAAAYGVKANPRPATVTQPDGTTLTLRLNGDEYFHYYTTDDGYAIERAADGFFYYLDNGATIGTMRANDSAVRSAAERRFLATLSKTEPAEALRQAGLRRSPQRSPGLMPTTFPTKGEVRGMVILVEYTDLAFTVPDARQEFSDMLNKEGYSNFGGTGSARDWFVEQSSGQFKPTFDVYGPVRLPHPMAYYGENGSNGDDLRAHEMLIDACDILDDEVDFTQYDVDGDGWIDNVFIFYAGYGENLGYGAPAEAVWPHSWDLREATNIPYMHDGVRLNHYACTNEIDLEDKMDGIGTFVHEFSHVLGLPDLYATGNSSAFTPGAWDVMDEGPYNNGSRTPPNYSAYERYALGWLTPRRIGDPANIRLGDITTNSACIIATPLENEYFLIENRQQKGWDTYIPGHGMLVWHVDYNENIWRYNNVNNRQSHQYVDIEEADGTQTVSSRDGDAFPGTRGVTSFTDDTTPSMRTWDGNGLDKPITEITENNGMIEFKISGGRDEVAPVTAYEASETGIDSFKASWSQGNAGCQYILSVYTVRQNGSGRPETTYVSGWEARNMGGELSATVTDLLPETEYRYSVRVSDPVTGMQSLASNEITVTTLPATFDYLRPELEPGIPQGDTCPVSWTPVDGAEDYLLSLYTKVYGEAETVTADFTGGVSSLPAGWESNSNLTYANAAYAGAAVPSLRFNTDGQWIATASCDEVRGIRFWARGVSASEQAAIELQARAATGDWTTVQSWPVNNATGENYAADATQQWPEGTSMLRILFHNGGKGSLALDDVTLLYGGNVEHDYFGGSQYFLTTPATSATLGNLLPATTYWLTVTGRQGDLLSKPSRERRIITGSSGINGIASAAGYSVLGRTVTVSAPARLYTLTGICVAEGEQTLAAPAPGMYVLATEGRSVKIIIK